MALSSATGADMVVTVSCRHTPIAGVIVTGTPAVAKARIRDNVLALSHTLSASMSRAPVLRIAENSRRYRTLFTTVVIGAALSSRHLPLSIVNCGQHHYALVTSIHHATMHKAAFKVGFVLLVLYCLLNMANNTALAVGGHIVVIVASGWSSSLYGQRRSVRCRRRTVIEDGVVGRCCRVTNTVNSVARLPLFYDDTNDTVMASRRWFELIGNVGVYVVNGYRGINATLVIARTLLRRHASCWLLCGRW